MPCPVCGHVEVSKGHRARESMVGLGEEFDYRECAGCASLYLAEVPADLGRYYDSGYYSFAPFESRYRTAFQRWSKRRIVEHLLVAPQLLGGWLRRGSRYVLYDLLEALRPEVLARGRRILDVGCGRGELLRLLANAGWPHLLGIDPFLEADLEHPGGLRVLRRDLAALEAGAWDTIMFHHSFEHVPDPVATLRLARDRLAPGGTVLLQLPTVSSRAWRRYRVDWAQLDAPRHLFVPSRRGLAALAAAADLELRELVDCSTAFQFWASEQVRRGIPVLDPRSYAVDPDVGTFSRAQLTDWDEAARAANAAGEGDQVFAYLGAA